MIFRDQKNIYRSELEYRDSFLLLRWLVIILSSYLILFRYIGNPSFIFVFAFVLVFSFTNVVLSLMSTGRFVTKTTQRAVAIADAVCISVCFYLLRVPGAYVYLPFIVIFILALVWRDLRLVLFSLFVVSVLYGVFAYFRLFGLQTQIDIEQFPTLALCFMVSIFYVFLDERLKSDARLSKEVFEEKRIAEIMLEITRALASSLRTGEILYIIVSKLREVVDAIECSIVRIEPGGNTGTILATSQDPTTRDVTIDLSDYPELIAAYKSQRTLLIPDVRKDLRVAASQSSRAASTRSVLAVPMIFQQSVLGVIGLRMDRNLEMSERTIQFFEVVASASANALRNAQLFEEVEHLSRTDFLTGLPNHRYFQLTLSIELGRAERYDQPLSLLIVDLDYLKVVNDRFGHPMGDFVIRTAADRIRSTCREIDVAARYGGEEFVVILPGTALAGAVYAAERIREKISESEVPGVGRITASIGIANYPVNAVTKEDLVSVADQALYTAKNGGRDRVAYFDYKLATR